MTQQRTSATSLGPNAWLVDEKYEQYLADPASVAESWREFFADYRPQTPKKPTTAAEPADSATPPTSTSTPTPSPPAPTSAAPAASTAPAKSAAPVEDEGEPLRGAAARVVANMENSLGVPTATSYRNVPTKLLEVNRKIINNHLQRSKGGKISFTHLIGYAMVRAMADAVPAMNASFVEGSDGKPRIVRHEHVGLGLAVDVEKSGGRRSLLVPVIRDADTMDFAEFWAAYDELIRKVTTNKLSPDDFVGATATLTNPGTIGTAQSVPRLMAGQGLIVGVGALGYPAEFAGADQSLLADLGVSKVMMVSSTYDHRIIQGAESGLFLKRLTELLTGDHDFYVDVFRALGTPYESVQWRRDVNPVDRTAAAIEKQLQVNSLVNMYRVRGHLIADLDPLAAEEPHMHSELDPATHGLTIWDLDRTFLTGGVADTHEMVLDDLLHVLRNAYCRTVGIEYMHISRPEVKRWIQQRVEGVPVEMSAEDQRHILGRLNAAEAFES
ncbi:MAG TPA: 2-oxo acid dehydrogenase subunit E2, partial [Acidimicrobiales bacterium]|nr:2-oxo acid dehydrogenase subunit E2 [Acidimicrobiales bacterium]